jgi:hypothetical protein
VSVNFRIALSGDTQSVETGEVKAFDKDALPITFAWRNCTV